MWTYFVLRAYNYFVLVLNSLKQFCLSSEQGFNRQKHLVRDFLTNFWDGDFQHIESKLIARPKKNCFNL